jgi:hypothetical protein
MDKIELQTIVLDAIEEVIELLEQRLLLKMDEFEQLGLEPKLTRTDVQLMFSRVNDELKQSREPECSISS